MAVSGAAFGALRSVVQGEVDRVAALAPEIERLLVAAYGPYWAQLLADADRRAGRSTSGLHDPRYLLRLIAHEPALTDRFDHDCRRVASILVTIANSVAHADLDRLRPDDGDTARRIADRLLAAAVPAPQPPGPPAATTPPPLPSASNRPPDHASPPLPPPGPPATSPLAWSAWTRIVWLTVAVVFGFAVVSIVPWTALVDYVGRVVADAKLDRSRAPSQLDCSRAHARPSAAASGLRCYGQPGSESAAVSVAYYGFDDRDDLRRYFARRTRNARRSATIARVPAGACASPGHLAPYATEHGARGTVLCTDRGLPAPRIEWVDSATLVYASASGLGRYPDLYRFWREDAGPRHDGHDNPPTKRR